MASSSGDGSRENPRRYPRNLEGLLQFATEVTRNEDAPGPSGFASMDPESWPRSATASSHKIGSTVAAATSLPNDPELARINQDRALEVLGLHRYRVAGDGNCLFRAVACQLKLDQEKYHPILRKAAVKWMRDNKEELLEWGLLDGEQEIDETEQPDSWPGQATIVALANIFCVNIAVVQGGDKGDIDIQHICPFTPDGGSSSEEGSIILAYLYNGHYDAVVEQPNMENPEFEAWSLRRKERYDADEALAWELAAQESLQESDIALSAMSNLSTSAESEPLQPTDSIQHVSNVQVSYKQPAAQPATNLAQEQVLSKPRLEKNTSASDSATTKSAIRTGKQHIAKDAVHHDVSQESENKGHIRITLYPKSQSDETAEERNTKVSQNRLNASSRPSHVSDVRHVNDEQLKVNRKRAELRVLQERQEHDKAAASAAAAAAHKTRSPSIRVIPIQFVGRQHADPSHGTTTHSSHRDIERRSAVKRKDFANAGYSHSRSQSSTDRDPPESRRSQTDYSSLNTCTRHHRDNLVVGQYVHTCEDYSNARNPRGPPPPTAPKPRRAAGVGAAVGQEKPVVVLSQRAPDLTPRARAMPAPVTYDLDQPFEVPPELRPYRTSIDFGNMELMLRRNFWH